MAVTPNTTAASPIEVGKAAPAFTLKDQQGQPHRLADQRGRWVVLYFYPRDNTPGCTKQACQFRDAADTFTDHNVTLLGVSPDDESSHAKFADKFALPFPLLADHDARVCRKYGVWQEKNMYGKKFFGVVRTTYLIDPRGKVAHRWDKVKVDGHADAVLARLNELDE
ncbi:MAG: thioredoxin-dependent thiol peroxidase [Phycisphaeraceae bacterium]